MGAILKLPLKPKYIRDKRMKGIEIILRNQFRSAELPTLAFVPHIKLTDKSKYRMRSAA